MGNALKFTEHGIVELGSRQQNGNLLLYVKDTGSGISHNEVKIIFDRFRKSNDQGNTLHRGTGLGLTISKGLAHILGGDLTVETEPGKGSTFVLNLPHIVLFR